MEIGNFNMSTMPMMPMYGGNFVDSLFRNILQNGWQGFGPLMVSILTCYLYLSLDYIKDLFKYINDILGVKFKKYSEIVSNKGSTYLKNCGNFVLNYFKPKFRIILTKITQNRFVKYFRKNEKIEQHKPIIIKKINRFTTNLEHKNKLDIIAIGNHLLRRRKEFSISENIRTNSDKYKAIEEYPLPVELTWIIDEVKVIFKQNIEFQLQCETDAINEILKDVSIKLPENFECTVSLNKFKNIYENWARDIPFNLRMDLHDYPRDFRSSVLDDDKSGPRHLFNEGWEYILCLIYITKDAVALRALIDFFFQEGSLFFLGKKYTLDKKYNLGPTAFKDNVNIDKFIKEVQEYWLNCVYHIDNHIEEFIEENKKTFDSVDKIINICSLEFQSETKSEYELSLFSREYMNKLIFEYYQQNTGKINNKVSIYQIKVVYDIIKTHKDNPAYIEWEEKYGKKEEEKKEEKKEDSEKKDEKKDEKKEDSSPKNTSRRRRPARTAQCGAYEYDDLFDYPYGTYPGAYSQIKPAKTIEVEEKVARVDCNHIKTDRKPFEYLYLQKKTKEGLTAYLNNFKDNKDLYQKFGFPYKGGILLSGVPGCGKTSTIMAIGTYLNKDVYYLDLGQIKTNHELKLCIDHINVNSQRGGIIIFEDIDCMTDIVLKRRDIEDSSTTKMAHSIDDKLSLSYLLNVIDGTMAPEDVIFIMTTNHADRLDPALTRPGRMDLSIELMRCDKYQLTCIYQDLYGKKIKLNRLKRFKEFEYITAEVILHLFHNIYNKDMKEEELLERFLMPKN